MKKVLLSVITVYQKLISPVLHQVLGVKTFCRNTPTCTLYAKKAILEYGAGKGFLLSVKRFINCQPLFSL